MNKEQVPTEETAKAYLKGLGLYNENEIQYAWKQVYYDQSQAFIKSALESQEQACEAIISQAKHCGTDDAESYCGDFSTVATFPVIVADWLNDNYEQYLTDQARAYLVQAGKITE